MHVVYILQSKQNSRRFYKGYTTDLKQRLKKHNSGTTKYTAKYKPWNLVFYCVFQSKKKALDFEKYLKTASGIAFMKKRLIDYY